MGFWDSLIEANLDPLGKGYPQAHHPHQLPPQKPKGRAVRKKHPDFGFPVNCWWCRKQIEPGMEFIHDEVDNVRWHIHGCHPLYKCWYRSRSHHIYKEKRRPNTFFLGMRRGTVDEALKTKSIALQYCKLAGIEEPTKEQFSVALEFAKYYPKQTFEDLFETFGKRRESVDSIS